MGPIVYRVDQKDCLQMVNDAWEQFATRNHGAACRRARVVGRRLWDFITDHDVTEVYRRLLLRVRDGHQARFTYRCDSPVFRREFEMRVTAIGSEVEFVSTLSSEDPRPRVALFDPAAPRAEAWIRMCAWCHQVSQPDGGWQPLELAVAQMDLLASEVPPRVTHGMCDGCSGQVLREFRRG